MKRKIRLTESEFHSLVRRLVRETQEEMEMPDDMRMSDNKETDYDPRVIRRIARFFKQKHISYQLE